MVQVFSRAATGPNNNLLRSSGQAVPAQVATGVGVNQRAVEEWRMAINGNGKKKSNFPEMHWDSERWKGIERPYTYADVERLRGTLHVEYSLAKAGAARLWELLQTQKYVAGLGAVTGNQ